MLKVSLFLFCNTSFGCVTTAKINIIVFASFCKIFSNKPFLHFIFLCLKLSELRKSSVVKRCSRLDGLHSGINASEVVQNDLL